MFHIDFVSFTNQKKQNLRDFSVLRGQLLSDYASHKGQFSFSPKFQRTDFTDVYSSKA
jgi:hypothetical protein